MKRFILFLMLAFVMAPGVFISVAAAQSAEPTPEPLTESKILTGLKGEISPRRLTVLVSRLGVNFTLTPEVERRLRAVGATDELIAAIRKAQNGVTTEEQTSSTIQSAGASKVNPRDGLRYSWIPPGSFQMGCSPGDSVCDVDEKPAHRVTITKGYWMGQTLVTQAAYQHVMNEPPSVSFVGDQLPVDKATWKEATSYCEAVGMRLPTEAEWEYAERAGNSGARYGDVDAISWNGDNSEKTTHPVALKQPNAWKLYDMLYRDARLAHIGDMDYGRMERRAAVVHVLCRTPHQRFHFICTDQRYIPGALSACRTFSKEACHVCFYDMPSLRLVTFTP